MWSWGVWEGSWGWGEKGVESREEREYHTKQKKQNKTKTNAQEREIILPFFAEEGVDTTTNGHVVLHERQPRDGLGNLHHLVQETQLFDRTKGVGSELDGGFGDGELLSAFEHDVVNSGALKTEC